MPRRGLCAPFFIVFFAKKFRQQLGAIEVKTKAYAGLIILTILSVSHLATAAQAPQEKIGKENLEKRVEKLEGKVEKLINIVQQQQVVIEQQKVEINAARDYQKNHLSHARLSKAQLELLKDAKKRDKGFFIHTDPNVKVRLYGKIKFDAATDTARTSTGNFARWVNSEDGNEKDTQFNMTANETRFGLDFDGPNTETLETSGKIEFDMYGNGTENSPEPRIRHAYMKLNWPKKKFSILAGQTWDVISPLHPNTLNYSVQWWAGNIGFRRPQIRLTKVCSLGDKVDLKLEGALTRTIGHTSGFDPGDTGEDAGFPTSQGRASISFPGIKGKKTTIGASGHFGMEEYDTNAQDSHMEAYSWSGNLDVNLPVCDWLSFKAEGFYGQDIDAYVGGIGQGIDVQGTSVTELRSMGGWVAANIKANDNWQFNVGVNGEFIDNRGKMTDGIRTANSAIFGNAIYKINSNAFVGFELSSWNTQYKAMENGNSIRAQTSFIYKF